jgi:hypothetical protein
VAVTEPTEVAADESSTLWWPWILGALLLVGIVVALIASRRHGPGWEDRTAAALAEADVLSSHLVGLAPGGVTGVAAADAARLAALGATMQTLMADAHDATGRSALEQVEAQVTVLHGLVDGIALTPTPPSAAAVEHLREQATALHTATAQARARILPQPVA